MLPLESAQRLSASKVSARIAAAWVFGVCRVLNAFRHQRFLRTTSDYVPLDVVYVLNAFRHQRFLREGDLEGEDGEVRLCSTPFGIKGFCASLRRS